MINGSYDSRANTYYNNTCAFDSAMFLIAFGLNLYPQIQSIIGNSKHLVAKYLQMLITKHKDATKVRVKLFAKYFHLTRENSNRVDCQCNVCKIFESILYELFTSADNIVSCIDCSKHIERPVVFLPIAVEAFAIQDLQIAIRVETTISDCRTRSCSGIVTNNCILKPIISIELLQNNIFSLSELPLTIQVQDKVYYMLGIIEFLMLGGEGGMGHYKCHVYNKNYWVSYDDLAPELERSSIHEKITIHTLTYVLIPDE